MLWLVAVMAGITVAVSAIAAVKIGATMRAVARCRGWRPVPGRVVAASLRQVSVGSVGPQYIPVVTYRYAVDGAEYTGESLSVGARVQYSLRRNAQRRIAPYVDGEPVQVLIDPSDPTKSVLECRAPILPLLWMTFLAVWIVLLVGLGLLLLPGVDGPEPILRLGTGTTESKSIIAGAACAAPRGRDV